MLLHYLGKQKAENCIFSLKRWVVLLTDTENTFILPFGHSLTTLHSHNNQPHVPNKTYEASIACYHLLPYTIHSSFTKSVMMSIAVSKVGVVPCRASSEKSKDIIGRISYYLNKCQLLSNALSTTILFAFQQHSSCMHRCMVRTTQFNSCCAKLSTSFLLSYSPQQARANQLNSINYEILEAIPARIRVSSQHDWLNSGKAVIQHLSEKDAMCVFLCFAR